jgi:hypothetical protein
MEGERKDAHASQAQMTTAPSSDENHQAPAQVSNVFCKLPDIYLVSGAL